MSLVRICREHPATSGSRNLEQWFADRYIRPDRAGEPKLLHGIARFFRGAVRAIPRIDFVKIECRRV